MINSRGVFRGERIYLHILRLEIFRNALNFVFKKRVGGNFQKNVTQIISVF